MPTLKPFHYLTGFGLVCVTASALAVGGPGPDRFPISIADAEARAAERFSKLDADGNGSVDAAEFESAKMRGHHHGKRGHGGDKRAHRPRGDSGPHKAERRAHWESMREQTETELFTILDADGNGALSAAEFSAGDREARKLAGRRAAFKMMDADKDGLLTAAEMPSPASRLKSLDADGNGEVSRDEMRAARRARSAP